MNATSIDIEFVESGVAIDIVGSRGTDKTVFARLFVIVMLVVALPWFAVLRAFTQAPPKST